MSSSPKLGWPVPSPRTNPWHDAFEALVSAIDASVFATREDRQLMLMNGGTFTFDSVTGVVTWSTAIEILSGINGLLWSIPAGSVTVTDSQMLYVRLVRSPTVNQTLTLLVSSAIPSDDDSLIIGIRRDDRVYLRGGKILENGVAVDILSSADWAPPGDASKVLLGDGTETANIPATVAANNLGGNPVDLSLVPGGVLRQVAGEVVTVDPASIGFVPSGTADQVLDGTGAAVPRTYVVTKTIAGAPVALSLVESACEVLAMEGSPGTTRGVLMDNAYTAPIGAELLVINATDAEQTITDPATMPYGIPVGSSRKFRWASPTELTPAEYPDTRVGLDGIGLDQGMVLYRGVGGWTALAAPAGVSYFLHPGGAANPLWYSAGFPWHSKEIAMADADQTPAAGDVAVGVLLVTGALTAPRTLTLPLTTARSWLLINATTGGFALTVKGSSGTGVDMYAGARFLRTDGVNFYAFDPGLPTGSGSGDMLFWDSISGTWQVLSNPGAEAFLSFDAGYPAWYTPEAMAEVAMYAGNGVRTLSFAVGTAATTDSTSLLPSNVTIHRVTVKIGTSYSVGGTISIGVAGTPAAFAATSDINAQGTAGDLFIIDQITAMPGAAANKVRATVGGAPAAGACTVLVEYSVPKA